MKHTKQLKEEVLETYKRLNANRSLTCKAHGINTYTFNQWRKTYQWFEDAVHEARNYCVNEMENVIYQSGLRGNTKAGLEWLKRNDPEKWGDNPIVIKGEIKIKTSISGMTDELIDKELAEMQKQLNELKNEQRTGD